jgi:hypothetical protein
MSSNIPKAREHIMEAIRILRDPSGKRAMVVRELNRALNVMTRKPRETTTEPKARKAYMTKALREKVRKTRELNPSLSAKIIARIYGTDPKRTARELGE